MSNNEIDPADKLKVLGTGLCKICCELSDKWVMKFTHNNSELRKERASVEAARQRGLGHLFCDVHYVVCPGIQVNNSSLVAAQQEDGNEHYTEEDGYSFKNTPLDVIIFQRKFDYPVMDLKKQYHVIDVDNIETLNEAIGEAWTKGVDMVNGRLVKAKLVGDHGYDEWRRDLKRCYGPTLVEEWEKFRETWDITDLHWNNIGYMHDPKNPDNPYMDRPVIIDWMSGGNETGRGQGTSYYSDESQ